ncbi:MAG: ribonuclease P protein component [Myxococcota bacterium]
MTGETGRRERLRRADRLLRSREFQHVTRQGRRAASRAYVILVCPGRDPERARLGLTVSRKVGNAVVRNRVKRRVREWFRHEGRAVAEGLDIVVIARREAAEMPLDESARMLSALVKRATPA